MQGLGFRIQDLERRIWELGFEGLGFRVWGLRFGG